MHRPGWHPYPYFLHLRQAFFVRLPRWLRQHPILRSEGLLIIAILISLSSGASVGREGPTVQICASLGSCIARWFPMNVAQIRTMVRKMVTSLN